MSMTRIVRTVSVLIGLCYCAAAPAAVPTPHTHNVILVTLDGVRTQEIFGGLDAAIARHSAALSYSEIEAVRSRYDAATAESRRAALMPVFWRRLVPQGVLFGDAALGAPMRVQNAQCVSSPGYVEMNSGAARAEVLDNSPRRYPYRGALQVVAEELRLDFPLVAQIGSWDGFSLAASSRDGAFLMSGGFDLLPPAVSTPEIESLGRLRREVLDLWEEGSDDALSFRIATAYLKAQRPRLMWIGLGNSDDWAHADRYDRLLTYLNLADGWLGELWSMLQDLDAYRGRTTLIVTTDHGRGLRGEDWSEHDCAIPGSEAIWALVVGPDTPATGEAMHTGELHQGQIAATVLQYFGLGPEALDAGALPPLPGTLAPAAGGVSDR